MPGLGMKVRRGRAGCGLWPLPVVLGLLLVVPFARSLQEFHPWWTFRLRGLPCRCEDLAA